MTSSKLLDDLLSELTKIVMKKLTAPLSSVSLTAIAGYILVGLDTTFADQTTRKAFLISMAILIGVSFLLTLIALRLFLMYGRFREAYGVSWDKNFNMRCLSCKKPIKNSSDSPSKFYCSDPKCNSKYILKDNSGAELTKQQAIDQLTQK